jgi:ribosomal protein S12 methylthiotransferase accessory factor
MTGNRRNRVAQHAGNDIPRFAPNFTVYLLPGDVVCLYSEDRKFFLHGELYCALASAIGEGGRTFRQLVSALERKFPADKVEEALTRLLDRRFIIGKRHGFLDTAAAYWASLGLSPEDAEKNLKQCPVRIQALDVTGATQLGAALAALGVRVAKRSAELTVTLVSDYLDGRLAELNRQHLSQRMPWLLVQPSGIFPLVGPAFSPGKSACWACLAGRMQRNREIKAMIDRAGARPRSQKRSPPASAPICATTSSASTCWARLSCGITCRRGRNVRSAAARRCATRAERRCQSSLAPAASS